MKLMFVRAWCAVSALFLASIVECKYLIVSSPATKSVFYAKLLSADQQSRGERLVLERLTADGELEDPMGIAVDSLRGVLYVADPTRQVVSAMRINEEFSGDKIYVDEPKDIVTGVDCHWVAVNSVGSLFYTDTSTSQVWTMSADEVDEKLSSGADNTLGSALAPSSEESSSSNEDHTGRELYAGSTATLLQAPEGIAVNGFSVFWANGQVGDQGVLVKGYEEPPALNKDVFLTALASNTESAFGVCLTSARVYYTDQSGKVYSTRIDGGAVKTVTDKLQSPRGCAYDGDGTIFVADKSDGKVYSFSGGGANLGTRLLSAQLEVEDAYGLAVFTPESSASRLSGALVLLFSAILVVLNA